VDRKVVQTAYYSEYELVSALDVSSVQLPRRTILQNLCPWRYKDATTCNYSYAVSPIYYKADGTVTPNVLEDVCGKRLSDCKLRFNQTTKILNFGGFPGAGLYT
jgi:lambda family phage minor tail protein L